MRNVIRLNVLVAALVAGCGPGKTSSGGNDLAQSTTPGADMATAGGGGDMAMPGGNDLAGDDLAGVDLAMSGGGDMSMVVPVDMATGCKSDNDCPKGTCNPNSGVCTVCAMDGDCTNPMAPRCQAMTGKCVPCLPTNDNCAMGTFCTQANGSYACSPGCKVDNDCANPDGGNGMGNAGKPICCNNICVDSNGDSTNCGRCGMACGMGQGCCAGACSDPTSDVNNCGSCGKACAGNNAQVACMASMCVLNSCNAGFADCDKNPANGCEVNLNTDPMNCTACGMACSVANGVAGCAMGCNIASCNPGFADCDKMYANGCEINTAVDVANCNACGMACGMIANGTAGCIMSKCGVASCTGSFLDCDKNPANGCEDDTSKDIGNCGACGKACAVPANATAGCSGGTCGIGKCTMGFADCNMSAIDGCEVNTGTDPMNCGSCKSVCGPIPNGAVGCANGICGVGKCTAGFADCNLNPGDGCEVNTNTDIKNCGACAHVCPTAPNDAPTCVAGVCGLAACMAPLMHCSQNPNSGCETNTSNDVSNCGACNAPCPNVFNGIRACINSMCGVGSCNQNFADCDMNPANGCEIQISNDPNNCGKCANKCALANASQACVNSVCAIGMCNAPFNDCDKNPVDGCESNSTSDVANCGACGNKCVIANGVAACVASACAVGSCTAPFADCNKLPNDGCEDNTSTDVNNCGACAMKCPAIANGVAGCAASKCGIASCNAPYADCDGNAGNGCEAKTDSDPMNCGGCKVVCGNGLCVNGACAENVLLVAADNVAWVNDVQSKLNGTGAFQAVDIFNAQAGTPTVVALQKYSTVLVWSDFAFNDPVALGNNLATYFDGGGRVVLATFSNVTGFGNDLLAGTFGTVGNGYMLLGPAAESFPAEMAALTIVDPNSPLTAGVAKLTAPDGYKVNGALVNGAITVAQWGSGAPLIVRGSKGNRALVQLNMFPPSAGADARFWTGDGATIMKNALLYKGYCHTIVAKNGATCVSGITSYCDPQNPLVATNGPQAAAACNACYGAACILNNGDCAGAGYCPTANPAGGDACYGYVAGCSGAAGRVWSYGSSFTTYGRWAP